MYRNEFGRMAFTPMEETRISDLALQFFDENLNAKELIQKYRTLNPRDFYTYIGMLISRAETKAEHQVEDEYFGGDAA